MSLSKMLRTALGSLGAATLLAATACHGPPLEESWGTAYQTNKAEMIENPDAEHENLSPVRGLDPNTADQVVDRYRKDQAKTRKSKAASEITVNIGK